MSLDRQPYEELCSNIRARPIGWDAHKRAGTLTESEVEKIKAVDKVERRIAVVEKHGDEYAKMFLGDSAPASESASESGYEGILGRNRTTPQAKDILLYILVLIGDLLDKVPTFSNSILSLPHPYTHLLPLLSHSDPTVPLFSSKILTTLIATSLNSFIKLNEAASNDTTTALPTFLSYLAGCTRSQESYLQDLAIQSYVELLRSSHARVIFWNMGDEALQPLIAILKTAAGGTGGSNSGEPSITGMIQGGVGLQLLYHVLLVIWELSFEEVVVDEIHEKYDLTPTLVHILRNAIKEKIARITTSILYNFATKSPDVNLPPMLVSKLLPLAQLTLARFTSDEDLASDLQYIVETLDNYQKSHTTFDEYAIEVRSGHLSWTPPHTNTDFWKKNAKRIVEENNGELIRPLARALSSDNKVVVAVAAHDVGVLIREIPEKRKMWEQSGVKSRLMELIGDSDASVRFEALTAVKGFLEHAFS